MLKNKMMVILNFLMFRCRQLYRFSADQGIHALFFLLCAACLLVFLYNRTFGIPQIWIQLFIAFVFIFIDSNRKDMQFIHYLKKKGKHIVLAEYISLITFIEIPYCLTKHIDHFAIIPFLTILFLAFSKNARSLFNRLPGFEIIIPLTKVLPLHAFEWRAGIRKHPFAFYFSYVLGLALLFLFPVTPLFIVFWLLLSGEFYSHIENKEMIQSYRVLENFSRKKIGAFFLTLNAVFFPHYLLYCILYPQQDRLNILLFSILILNIIATYIFLYKYKFAMTGRQQVYNTVPLIGFIFIVLIVPLSIYLIFNLWNNIKTRLKLYLK